MQRKTSYARKDIIESSQKIRDYSLQKYGKDLYVYSDTDSIHCLFDESEDLSEVLEIDDYKLGAWKLESKFMRGKYLRQKCYIELDYNENLNVTVAGLPKKLSDIITFENFDYGFTTENIDMKKDKKNSSATIRFVLQRDIANTEILEIADSNIVQVL